jgi:hypothetical protein
MYLLIGFVNQVFTPQLTLAVLDVRTEKLYWINNEKLTNGTEKARGVNGLIKYRDKFVVGFQSSPTKLAIINGDFSINKILTLKEVENLHSFCVFDGKILCVSTGTDEVFALTLNEEFDLTNIELWWRHPNNQRQGEDSNHVNSIATDGNYVYVTCFGEKHKDGWQESKNGKVINASKNEVLIQGLHHPHTLYFQDGKWMLCESGGENIVTADNKKYFLGGYLRGITEDEKHLYVGVSGKRSISRSKGTLNAGFASSAEETASFINIIDKNSFESLKRIDLGIYGAEIFDLILVNDRVLPDWILENNATRMQISHLEEHILDLITQGSKKGIARTLFHKLRKNYLS